MAWESMKGYARALGCLHVPSLWKCNYRCKWTWETEVLEPNCGPRKWESIRFSLLRVLAHDLKQNLSFSASVSSSRGRAQMKIWNRPGQRERVAPLGRKNRLWPLCACHSNACSSSVSAPLASLLPHTENFFLPHATFWNTELRHCRNVAFKTAKSIHMETFCVSFPRCC